MRIGSLFSGAGGLDMAVEAVFDGEVIWQSEMDKAASKVLAYRFPCAPNLGDITAVDWKTVEPVDVLCGGFPCQDVSAAGKRAGIKDGTRSGLWSVFADAIDQLRPQFVVIENVRGLLSARAHRDMESAEPTLGDGAGRPVLRAAGAVLGDLADLGYDAKWTTLAAADAGGPHRRERVFVLAANAAISSSPGLQQQDLSALQQRRGNRRPGKSGVCDCRDSACGTDASHSTRHGRDEGRPEPARQQRGFDAAVSGDEPGLIECVWCRRLIQAGTETSHPCVGEKAAMLPTPRATDGTDGPVTNCPSVQAICDGSAGRSPRLSEMAAGGLFGDEPGVALLPTPCVVDRLATGDMTLDEWDECRRSQKERGVSSFGPRGDSLGAAVLRVEERSEKPDYSTTGARRRSDGDIDLLPTPMSCDYKGGLDTTDPDRQRGLLKNMVRDLHDATALLPTSVATDGQRGQDFARAGRDGSGGDDLVTLVVKADRDQRWGKYAAAITRWEQLVGPAPAPTEPNSKGNPRLSPAFSEWMMGWPPGWVTDPDIGISRNDQLRIIGNGVCPQQAVAALRFLLSVSELAA